VTRKESRLTSMSTSAESRDRITAARLVRVTRTNTASEGREFST
jgi:hypothetical protein